MNYNDLPADLKKLIKKHGEIIISANIKKNEIFVKVVSKPVKLKEGNN